ncbi:MAG: UDP-N-acetylglucosamine 1-carboxyvinyltransferase, partial [Hyphomicrobiales bacterium]|nr:UDP-N-acetylglucosamine 1-carboxyvinyltransferase [Hyphomicrobiales bacterium]
DGAVTLTNVPNVVDIKSMAGLLAELGVDVSLSATEPYGLSAVLRAHDVRHTTAPYELVRKMRASVLVLGPLVGRFGHARVSLPGGCAIGTRPIDLHLKVLEAMGAEITLESGYVDVRATRRLAAAEFTFPSVTVTGTENALMAAALADGESILRNAAREPEVTDLAQCLCAMGALIDGIGTDTLRIQGRERLKSASYHVIADRIETGTYAIAAAITGGSVELTGTQMALVKPIEDILARAGVRISATENGLRVGRINGAVAGVDIMTEPFPGFPTDMQAQAMTLMTVAEGASMITETVFENRFMHVPELCRMGANINVHGASAIIRGVPHLSGAPVMATDLRASVSLVLAGLAAHGDTIINRIYHLDRGYEKLEHKLAACGADIERLPEQDH